MTAASAEAPCTVLDSGMGAAPFRTEGRGLEVEMARLDADLPPAAGPEEMLAVLEGRVRLVCDDETHDLTAGQGVLIPAGLSRSLVVEGSALVYRVRKK